MERMQKKAVSRETSGFVNSAASGAFVAVQKKMKDKNIFICGAFLLIVYPSVAFNNIVQHLKNNIDLFA